MFELRSKLSLLVENLTALYGLNGTTSEREQLGLERLLEECLTFIEEAVARMLPHRSEAVGLHLLDECLQTETATPFHVVTLNHDTLIETHLQRFTISDGFVPLSAEAMKFDHTSFDTHPSPRVQILKLHGSVNWFRYIVGGDTEVAVKVLTDDPDHIKGPHSEDLLPPTGRLMLAGTINKELAYGSGIFIELMFQLQRRLRETETLIVSGYGFGDKGINNRIWAWMDARPNNRLVILHADFEALRNAAKPSFANNQQRYSKAKKLAVVDHWMCDSSLEEVRREMRIAFR